MASTYEGRRHGKADRHRRAVGERRTADPRGQAPLSLPGRKRIDDLRAPTGILFVLRTGISWPDLPQEMGYGSGMTCWRRVREWNEAGVWQELHEVLLARATPATHQAPDRATQEPTRLGLGKKRWVVERMISWLHQKRKLRIRYERRDDIHEALRQIGCALTCFSRLQAVESLC